MSPKNSLSYVSYFDNAPQRAIVNLLEVLSGRGRVEKIYDDFRQADFEDSNFFAEAMRRLSLSLHCNHEMLLQVPADQPLVVVANHPFGVVDGLAICELIARIRPNFKVVLNSVLCRDERMSAYTLPIDFGQSRQALLTNIETKRACLRELKQGGTIVIFPAGGVATAPTAFAPAVDLDWKPFTAKLIQASQATVLPVYFHGQNSRLFQIVSQFSLTLRLGLYLYEVNKKIGSTVEAVIGQPIPYDNLAHIPQRDMLLNVLRDEIYALASRPPPFHLANS